MFTERSLKMLPTLKSDSQGDVPDEWFWYHYSSDWEANGLELTHSPTPCEFDDNNLRFSLLEWRIKAVFSFFAEVQARTTYQVIPHVLHHFEYIWLVMRELRRFSHAFWVFVSHWFGLNSSEKDRFLAFVSCCDLKQRSLRITDALIYRERWSHQYMQWCQGIYCWPGVSPTSVLVSDSIESEADKEK